MQAGAGNIDLVHRGVGADLPARPENQFAPWPGAAANFAYADQHMAGAMMTSTSGPAGALMQTRADASLAGAGAATGYAGMGGTASFSFSLGVGEYMTIAFDALPFTQAYAGAGTPGSASANLAWTISVTDLSTGAVVFAFQPEPLNAMSNVSRNDALAGATTYQPGWLTFAATTSMLDVGDIYQVSIGQGSFASALQSQQVPEPATLAGFGAGLLAIAALGRRRRR